jgi:hypothetical protein
MRIISFMVRQAHHARLPLILSLSKDGWQGQDRRQKFMTRQWDMTESCPTTPLPISNSKHADTISGDPEYSWDAYIHA